MKIKTEENSAVLSRLHWRRSTKCANESCVEVAISGKKVYIRSSKSQTVGAYLVFDAGEWRSFLAGARNSEFDID
jgi:Domain of unknown function (DUF397)